MKQTPFCVQIFSKNPVNGREKQISQYVNGIVNVSRLLNIYNPPKGYEVVEILITPTLELGID